MTKSAEYKWKVELIQDRLQYLSVTFAQAEQIYLHEQNFSMHGGIHYFSPWEEWDYEETVFGDILSDDQFSVYKARFQKAIKRHNALLIESDNKEIHTINYYTEIIDHYEQKFLPEVFNVPGYLHLSVLAEIQSKIDYLKEEYRKFLADYRREIIINHVRYNKTLCSNKLKSQLLAHKVLYLLPNVFSFKGKMDEPTKSVLMFVKGKLYLIIDEIYNSWKTRLQELSTFNENLRKKYYPEPGPWLFYGQQSADEEKKEEVISLLLLDKNKYGWNPSLLR